MASAWGSSWGSAWGNAWGLISSLTPAGGYDDDKPKRKIFFRLVGDKLLVFNSATDAINADEPVKKKQKEERVEQRPIQQVSVAEIKTLATQYEEPAIVHLFDQQRYEQMLALYESLLRQRDEEEVELLLLAL